MKKQLLIFAFVLISTSITAQQPQQQLWYLDNQAIDFRGATPTLINGLPGFPSTPNNINMTSRNGVHDKNGNLLFYIAEDNIINKNGVIIGQLSVFSTQTRGEVAIVPVEGSCTQFFVIEQNTSFSPRCFNLFYSVVDITLNGGQGGVVSSSNVLSSCGFIEGSTIAVGKLNTNNTHFLYQVGILGNNGNRLEILRYTINTNGTITPSVSLFSSSTIGGFTPVSELDLSFSNDMLTFAQDGNLFVLYLDGNGNVNTTMGNQGNGLSKFFIGGNLSGVEFSPNGNNLFVGQFGIGIRVINPLTGSFTQPLAQSTTYGHSQLELAYDANGNNKIYVLNANGDLGQISNPDAIAVSNILFTPAVLSGINLTEDPTITFGRLQLPDQIDGMDYTAHFTATPECCITFTTLDVQEDKANQYYGGSQTWSPGATNNPFGSTTGTVTVKDILFIQNGANIIVNNMRFEFAPGARLIVENGAKLTINNTTLTVYTSCGGTGLMWQGVEVWGQPGNQSVVSGWFTANNSLIEHALSGAVNFKRPLSLTTGGLIPNIQGFNGGIIRSTNSTFRNNAKDLVFNVYTATFNNNAINDQSRFINTTFITDAPLNDASLSNASIVHATLNSVIGITFTRCTFTNTAVIQALPGQFPELIRGSGIIVNDAKFSVQGSCANLSFPCTSFNNSVFNNLTIGIRSIAVNRTQTAIITNTTFFNNWRSVFLRGMDLANTSDNQFNVGPSAASSPLRSYGLYLDNCSGYKVENNNFTTSFGGFLGVYVNNSGTANNEIYRNTFSNLVVASQSAQINGNGLDFGTGLAFRCNQYATISDYDILISSGLLKDDHGLCGNVLAPANNRFSYTASGDFWATPNSLGTPTYRYSPQGSSNLMPRNGFFNIQNTAEQVCTNLPVFNPTTSCPVRVPRTRAQLSAALSGMRITLDSLTGLIDAGSTQTLLNLIATQSGGNVKNALLAASPYLTDAVLLAYLATHPSNGHLQQILLANSPLSEAVAAYLATMNIPKGIKNQITNAQTGISAMEILNQEITFTTNEIERTENDLVRELLFDEVTNDGFKLVEDFLMQNTSRTNAQEQLLALVRIANQDSTAARAQLGVLDSNVINADFCKLHNTVIDVMNRAEGTMVLATDSAKATLVAEVADATTNRQEVANAQALLEATGLRIPYNEVIEIVAPQTGNNLRVGSANNETNTTNTKENFVTLYPNPAKNQLTIAHNLEPKNGAVALQIVDVMGRVLINNTINNSTNNIEINNLSSGLYFFTVSQNGNVVESGKLVKE